MVRAVMHAQSSKLRVLVFRGPAGTGRVETARDLGKQAGWCTHLVECSDQMEGGLIRRLTEQKKVDKNTLLVFSDFHKCTIDFQKRIL